MTNAATWRRICALICPDDPSLAKDVEQAFGEPVSYFAIHEDQLWERGIDAPSGVDPWLALVDGLIERKLAHEFDWKIEKAEIHHQLKQLRLGRGPLDSFPNLSASSAEGEPLFAAAAQDLLRANLALMWFDIDSDSYPVVVVPANLAADLQNLARALGYSINGFSTAA